MVPAPLFEPRRDDGRGMLGLWLRADKHSVRLRTVPVLWTTETSRDPPLAEGAESSGSSQWPPSAGWRFVLLTSRHADSERKVGRAASGYSGILVRACAQTLLRKASRSSCNMPSRLRHILVVIARIGLHGHRLDGRDALEAGQRPPTGQVGDLAHTVRQTHPVTTECSSSCGQGTVRKAKAATRPLSVIGPCTVFRGMKIRSPVFTRLDSSPTRNPHSPSRTSTTSS